MCKKGLEFIKTVAKYMSETNGYDRLMKNVSKFCAVERPHYVSKLKGSVEN